MASNRTPAGRMKRVSSQQEPANVPQPNCSPAKGTLADALPRIDQPKTLTSECSKHHHKTNYSKLVDQRRHRPATNNQQSATIKHQKASQSVNSKLNSHQQLCVGCLHKTLSRKRGNTSEEHRIEAKKVYIEAGKVCV